MYLHGADLWDGVTLEDVVEQSARRETHPVTRSSPRTVPQERLPLHRG